MSLQTLQTGASGTTQYAIAGVNFLGSHDGMTLADIASYERKHNEANGENNRDGTEDDCSANWGVEGPADDPAVNELRQRVIRRADAQHVMVQIERSRRHFAFYEVPKEQRMIGGLLEIHFDDALVVVRQRGTAIDDFAARIR